jgi:hypothetical protein
VPAEKAGPLLATPAPEIGVGPLAVNVQCEGNDVPPSSFTTCLISVRLGATSSLVIVQLPPPEPMRIWLPVRLTSPAQAHWLAT